VRVLKRGEGKPFLGKPLEWVFNTSPQSEMLYLFVVEICSIYLIPEFQAEAYKMSKIKSKPKFILE